MVFIGKVLVGDLVAGFVQFIDVADVGVLNTGIVLGPVATH